MKTSQYFKIQTERLNSNSFNKQYKNKNPRSDCEGKQSLLQFHAYICWIKFKFGVNCV